MEQNLERCRKCEENGSGSLFKCGVAKHLKESTHGCKVSGNERYLCFYLWFLWDPTVQYGENEVRHLMALKEVNAKEPPDMTQKEVIALKDLDDAFVLAKDAANKASAEDLLMELDTNETNE